MSEQWTHLDRLYRQIPSIDCKGECHTSCGPIALTTAELDRIQHVRGGAVPEPTCLDCPLLTADKRCSVYAVRPVICRLWGVVESMPCRFGCKPERYLTDQEAGMILTQAHVIGGDEWWIGNMEAIEAVVLGEESS